MTPITLTHLITLLRARPCEGAMGGQDAEDYVKQLQSNIPPVKQGEQLRDTYLFLPGDIFVRDSQEGAVLFELWQCTKAFERARNGNRCKVDGLKLTQQDPIGRTFLLDTTVSSKFALLGSVVPDLIIPMESLNLQRVRGSGTLEFLLNSDCLDDITEAVNNAAELRANPLPEADPEPEDPALVARAQRLQQEKNINFVAQNLRRSQRPRAPNHTIMDDARMGFAGYQPQGHYGHGR
jgi:hypothetical protein